MMLSLPDDAPDWVVSHCTALCLTKPPFAGGDGDPKKMAIDLRNQAVFIAKHAHPGVGDVYLQLLEMHIRSESFTVPLDHYIDRDQVLLDFQEFGFEAELVFIGWAYSFEAVEGHPLLEDKASCILCGEPIEEGNKVVIMPVPDAGFQPSHVRPCLAQHMGLEAAIDAQNQEDVR